MTSIAACVGSSKCTCCRLNYAQEPATCLFELCAFNRKLGSDAAAIDELEQVCLLRRELIPPFACSLACFLFANVADCTVRTSHHEGATLLHIDLHMQARAGSPAQRSRDGSARRRGREQQQRAPPPRVPVVTSLSWSATGQTIGASFGRWV